MKTNISLLSVVFALMLTSGCAYNSGNYGKAPYPLPPDNGQPAVVTTNTVHSDAEGTFTNITTITKSYLAAVLENNEGTRNMVVNVAQANRPVFIPGNNGGFNSSGNCGVNVSAPYEPVYGSGVWGQRSTVSTLAMTGVNVGGPNEATFGTGVWGK